MRSKDLTVKVRQYNKTGCTDTEMSYSDFLIKYKDNLVNAFEEWLIENEEKLPMSCIADSYEETRQNMLEYFKKDLCKNFNHYAYRISTITEDKDGISYRMVRCFDDLKGTYNFKLLPYIHLMQGKACYL